MSLYRAKFWYSNFVMNYLDKYLIYWWVLTALFVECYTMNKLNKSLAGAVLCIQVIPPSQATKQVVNITIHIKCTWEKLAEKKHNKSKIYTKICWKNARIGQWKVWNFKIVNSSTLSNVYKSLKNFIVPPSRYSK